MKEIKKLKLIVTLVILIFSITIVFLTILVTNDDMQISIKNLSLSPLIMIVLATTALCMLVRIAINRIIIITKSP